MAGIGDMKRIQVVKITPSQGVNGRNINTKSKYTYWAEVTRLSGGRNYQNSQTQLNDGYRFRIRYNETIDPSASYSVVYNGMQFTVTSVYRENEKKFYWILDTQAKHG